MTNEEFPDGHPYPRQQPDDTRPNQNWDTTGADKSKVVFAVVVVAIILLVLLGVSMCSRTSVVTPGNENIGGSDILQRNVDAAFDSIRDENPQNRVRDNNPPDTAQPAPQPTTSVTQEEQRRMGQTPEERELERLEQLRQIQEQREEIEQQQRNAVPSLLPENPPAPANLGAY